MKNIWNILQNFADTGPDEPDGRWSSLTKVELERMVVNYLMSSDLIIIGAFSAKKNHDYMSDYSRRLCGWF